MLLPFTSARTASFKEEAHVFVEQLVNKAATQLTENSISQVERIERMNAFFNNYFAVESIGKWILGRYWIKASEKERGEYLVLFQDIIITLLIDRFSLNSKKSLRIHKSKIQDAENITIFSEIHQKKGFLPLELIDELLVQVTL